MWCTCCVALLTVHAVPYPGCTQGRGIKRAVVVPDADTVLAASICYRSMKRNFLHLPGCAQHTSRIPTGLGLYTVSVGVREGPL